MKERIKNVWEFIIFWFFSWKYVFRLFKDIAIYETKK
jgi:hypothetical protein